jgi:general secretion pathway protein M
VNFAGIEPWRGRWNALGARERQALAVLAVFLGALLCYLLIWSPVRDGHARALARVASVQAQLARVQEQAELVARVRNAPRVAPAPDAAAAVEQAAERQGLRGQLKRVDAEGAGAVRVRIEDASFAALMAWLVELQQQSGLRAENAMFERQTNPGIVNARLLLRPLSFAAPGAPVGGVSASSAPPPIAPRVGIAGPVRAAPITVRPGIDPVLAPPNPDPALAEQ